MDVEGSLEVEKTGKEDCLCERKWPATALGLAILALGVIGFISACLLLNMKTLQYKYHYGVVLDAGSSHTDIVVYKWPSNYKQNGTAKVQQIGFDTCSDTGISSFKENPDGVETVLKKCIENTALVKIPPKEVQRTRLYLGATAGMRLLCARDKTTCEKIMVATKRSLEAYNFVIENDAVKILTGEQEGVCGWISANILSGALVHEKGNFQPSNLVGALDLGGASLEMTFYPTSVTAKEIPMSERADIKLYGEKYTLYSHSYLCYGLKEIERRVLAKLVQHSGFEKDVTNPCFPTGFHVTYSAHYLWSEPCSPVPARTIFPQTENASYTIHGGSSYSDCKSLVTTLFNKSGCDNYPQGHCSFDGVYQPPVSGKFLAFSGFAFVANALNITSRDSVAVFDDKAKEICQKIWNETEVAMRNNPLEFRHKYCFNSVYIYQILTDGFHFSKNSTDVQPIEKIGDSQVGWSLGFMVNATNLIPNDSKANRITRSEYVAIMAASGLLSLIGLVLLVVCCLNNRRRSTPRYRPLGSVN